jgi:5-deoxy-D-glucuronate isomerase
MGELAQVVPKECNLVMGSVVNDAWADRIQLLVFVTDRKRIVTSRPAAATGAAPAKGRKKKSVARQDKLKLEARGKGRFKDVEATLMDGQNLDIPTYVRLGIKLKK